MNIANGEPRDFGLFLIEIDIYDEYLVDFLTGGEIVSEMVAVSSDFFVAIEARGASRKIITTKQ